MRRRPLIAQLSIRGRLTITRHRAPRVLTRDELNVALRRREADVVAVDNLVVNQGLQAIACLLGNGLGSPLVGGMGFSELNNIAVWSMQIGNTVSPPTPAPTDTSGVGSLVYTITAPTLIVTYPANGQVQFSGLVPNAELNGYTLTEEALLLQNGLVFAKTTFAPEPKASSFGLQFDHLLSVTT
jgi:hypothetical protein